jgi:hypothetical protein
MNTHRITTMAMAVALAGFAHTLAAEENIPTTAASDSFQQRATDQKPETENAVPEMYFLASELEMPAQPVAQPADNLLSDLKVYPSF